MKTIRTILIILCLIFLVGMLYGLFLLPEWRIFWGSFAGFWIAVILYLISGLDEKD